MTRKLWLSVAGLAVGAGLLAAAGVASPASSGASAKPGATPKKGGTLNVGLSTDVDYVDPALAYFTHSWNIQFITCAKLFNYPDKPAPEGATVVPEVSDGFPKISKDGKTYTINLKKTYKFHTGAPVTAQSFVDAFNRDANPKMQSPATSYMHEIVGADAVLDGKAAAISGVKATGTYVLQIKLLQALPDLVARLTMPFFCPLLPNTPIEPDGINNPAGSGPYYISERTVNRQVVIKRNPFYKGPRTANVDQFIWQIGQTLEACYLNTERGAIDLCFDGIPTTSYKEVVDKYGINKERFWFYTQLGTSYFALNHDRDNFKNNVPLAKAINQAIDRPALVRASGFLGGKRTDQILPPAMTRDVNLYPIKGANPELAKKTLAGARVKPDKLVLYTATRGARVVRAQIFQFNMKQIGIDVEVQQFARAVQHEKSATRGEAFDVTDEGWVVDYADPVTYFDPLLNGNNIQETGNSNEAYFNDPKFNKEIERVAALTGAERAKGWADLDIAIMRDNPPWAPFLNFSNRDFVSKRFGCYLYHPVFLVDWSVACVK